MSGIEVLSPSLADDLHGLLVGHGRLVDAPADQRVVDVGHRHQPRRDRNLVAGQSSRIADAIPLLLVRQAISLASSRKSTGVAQLPLGLLDRVAAERRVGLHDLELFRRQLARLEQDAVGDADLADVVQRRRLVQQLDARGRVQYPANRGWSRSFIASAFT